mmetsp:Transcript_8782/g.19960  ORF Transcript_8782/g.19960 Transcript_8782/m.19960 type:complete len:85 (-) Transcript_8782:579-833(-)
MRMTMMMMTGLAGGSKGFDAGTACSKSVFSFASRRSTRPSTPAGLDECAGCQETLSDCLHKLPNVEDGGEQESQEQSLLLHVVR